MQIQLNTDNNVLGSKRLTERVEGMLSDSLSRFSDRVTRVEVHLNDTNGDKHGATDKRCMLEARVRNHQPVSVSHEAAEFGLAVEGAAGKLVRALDRLFGRFDAQRRGGQRHGKGPDVSPANDTTPDDD